MEDEKKIRDSMLEESEKLKARIEESEKQIQAMHLREENLKSEIVTRESALLQENQQLVQENTELRRLSLSLNFSDLEDSDQSAVMTQASSHEPVSLQETEEKDHQGL
eukprot:Awhi_evm1s13781